MEIIIIKSGLEHIRKQYKAFYRIFLLVQALCFVNLAGPILWYFPIRPA